MKPFFLALLALVSFPAFSQNSPGGWTSLFDGKTLNGWKPMGGKAPFTVENGVITGRTVSDTVNSFLVTEKEYGDFVLELEVMIEDTNSNSGIQFRSHFDPAAFHGRGRVVGYQYELDPSSRAWTGGVYDEGRRDWLYPLDLNGSAKKAYRHGQFNKVRIECFGSRIRTWVNDVPAAWVEDEVDRSGFIALQVHAIRKPEMENKRIYWKNIRIQNMPIKSRTFPPGIFVVNTTPNQLRPDEAAAGWKLLFDGKTSAGWTGAYKDHFPDKGWSVDNGMLTVQASQGNESTNGGDIVTKEKFSAFDLSFEFRFTPGANSGVKYFVTLSENNTGSAIGLEYQVLDDTLHPDAKLGRDGNRTLASLYDLIKAEKTKRFIRQPGEWNRGRVVVYPDNHVEHYLNGVKVLEYDRGSETYRQLVAISKYKVWPNFGEAKEGHILLQDHGNEVSFRSIRLRKLK